MQHWQNYINGEWLGEAETMVASNPATGETIGMLPKSSRTTARRAIGAARKAQAAWAARSAWECAEVCRAIAGAINERRGEIARVVCQEQGKPLAEAMGEVGKAADGFRLAASLVTQMRGDTMPAEDAKKLVLTIRQPRGVYAVITPWNFPVNIPVEYLAPGSRRETRSYGCPRRPRRRAPWH